MKPELKLINYELEDFKFDAVKCAEETAMFKKIQDK